MAKLMINYGDHKGRVRARTTVDKVAKAYAQLDLGSTAGND